jgi:hypothetical protein
MCFTRDLAFGKKYQEIAKTLLPEGEVVTEEPKGHFKDYDFETNVSTYEVKSDRMAYKYGCKSMFIEFECNKKPSGINSTTAGYWFYFMVKPDGTHVVFKIPTEEIKKKCASSRIICGGDGGRVRGYVVMVDDLLQYKLLD